MDTKTDCLEYINRKLNRTSDWRRAQAVRFPEDMTRNARAARQLLRLATTADEINEDRWQQLSPHFDPSSEDGWSDLVTRYARDVGFRTKPETFEAFIETNLDTLAVRA
jgi:hypothetical protein